MFSTFYLVLLGKCFKKKLNILLQLARFSGQLANTIWQIDEIDECLLASWYNRRWNAHLVSSVTNRRLEWSIQWSPMKFHRCNWFGTALRAFSPSANCNSPLWLQLFAIVSSKNILSKFSPNFSHNYGRSFNYNWSGLLHREKPASFWTLSSERCSPKVRPGAFGSPSRMHFYDWWWMHVGQRISGRDTFDCTVVIRSRRFTRAFQVPSKRLVGHSKQRRIING